MPGTAYRAGLNRNDNVPPLLKSVQRSELGRQFSTVARNASPARVSVARQLPSGILEQDESFIFAEPLSDDDEAADNLTELNGSDDEEMGRGDIRPTSFRVRGKIQQSFTSGLEDDDGFGPIRDNTSAARNILQTKSPLRRSKRNESESVRSIQKKPKLELAFKAKELDIFNIATSKSRPKSARKYGFQSKSPETREGQLLGDSPPKAIFRKPPHVRFDSPQSPEKSFKLPGKVASEEPEMEVQKTFKTFDIPVHSPELSPDEAPKFKFGLDLSELPPPLDFKSLDFRPCDVMEVRKQSDSLVRDTVDRFPFRLIENGEVAQSQLHIFQMPSATLDLARISQPEATEANCLKESCLDITSSPLQNAAQAACPMCGESVDSIFLSKYNNGKRMNIRTQTKFCRAHKKKSARTLWNENGYPHISWSDFDARLAQHHSHLKSLLDGATPSHYRNLLAEQVRSGKDRTLLQAVTNSDISLTPGYYGSRGFRAMSENIIDKFSSQLRRIAVTDRLVAARGVTGYVQNVLVPELAVRLISEDMGLEPEQARQVMRDSVGLGDLLNEEVEDVVTWKEGEDTL